MKQIVAIVADGYKFKIVYCGRAVQRTDYYPYGLPHSETSPSLQPYKHSGKEFDTMLGLNTGDFHARAYFPAAVLW